MLPKNFSARRFNRGCCAVALLYLVASTFFAQLRLPIYGDFVQFYMTGLVDRAGAWDALYPVPMHGSIYNAGTFRDSTAKPAYLQIANAHGVDFTPYYFIMPPPAALLFWPLGYWDGPTAYRVWLIFSILAAWIVALQGGMLLQRCRGAATPLSGLVVLLIACSPPMCRAVLVANVTPFIAVLIGWSVLSLTPPQRERSGAAGIVLGAMCKYVTVMFLPLVLAQRRWRTLAWIVATALLWCAVALVVMGAGPFHDYLATIAPTLGRSHDRSDNISLAGIILHVLHRAPPIPSALSIPLVALQAITLGLILLPLFLRSQQLMSDAPGVCAAATALLCWTLIFSPIAWSHYLMYLCPLWGWLVYEVTRRHWPGVLAAVAIALVFFSWSQVPSPAIDPWGLRLFVSLALMFVVALWRLWSPGLVLSPNPQTALGRSESFNLRLQT